MLPFMAPQVLNQFHHGKHAYDQQDGNGAV